MGTTKAAFITTRHRKQHRLYHNNLCYTHEYFFHTQGVVLYYIERVVSSVLHLVVLYSSLVHGEKIYIFLLTRGVDKTKKTNASSGAHA